MHITDTDHGISAAREDAAEAAGMFAHRCSLAIVSRSATQLADHVALVQVHSKAPSKTPQGVTLLQD